MTTIKCPLCAWQHLGPGLDRVASRKAPRTEEEKMTISPKAGHRYHTRGGWITPQMPDTLDPDCFRVGGLTWARVNGMRTCARADWDLVAEYVAPRWISTGERLPTEADADENGFVAFQGIVGVVFAIRWMDANKRHECTRWHPLAKYQPAPPREIEAHGRTYVLKEVM